MVRRRKPANLRRTEKVTSGFHAVAFHVTEPRRCAPIGRRAATSHRRFACRGSFDRAVVGGVDPRLALGQSPAGPSERRLPMLPRALCRRAPGSCIVPRQRAINAEPRVAIHSRRAARNAGMIATQE
jgi:hypothetical protein